MLMHLSHLDLSDAFPDTTIDRATDLWADNGVLEVEVSSDGRHIGAIVQGSRQEPYRQKIKLTPKQRGIKIESTCTCPMRLNCKHVAAALLELLFRFEMENETGAPGDLNDHGDTAVGTGPMLLPAVVDRNLPAPAASVPPAPSNSMSPDVLAWLTRLASATAPVVPAAPAPANPNLRYLVFVLNHELPAGWKDAAPVRLRAVTYKLTKAGLITDVRHYDLDNILRPRDQIPRSFTDADIALLNDLFLLKRRGTHVPYNDVVLGPDALSTDVLRRVIGSGLLRYGSPDGHRLNSGSAIRAEPQWLKTDRGAQCLAFVPAVPITDDAPIADDAQGAPATIVFDHVLPLVPPHYISLDSGLAGPIVTDLPPAIALEIARAPTIALSEAARVKEMMRHRVTAVPIAPAAPGATGDATELVAQPPVAHLLPLPDAPDDVELRTIRPIPRLQLMMTKARLERSVLWYTSEPKHHTGFPLPIARLAFDYGGEIVAFHAANGTLERIENGRLILMPRDHKAELAAAELLGRYGMAPLLKMPFDIVPEHERDLYLQPSKVSIYDFVKVFDQPERFIAFGTEAIPELVSSGWQIEFSDDYPYRIADGDVQWWADTEEGSGIDWMSFELGIEFEGHRINLVPQLAAMLAKLPSEAAALAFSADTAEQFNTICRKLMLYHALPDGRLLPLPGDRMAPILKSLLELIGPRGHRLQNGKIKLHRADAAALAAFAGGVGLDVAWAASAERLIALGQRLTAGRGVTVIKPPKTFKASLRPYQSDGLAWLDFLRDAGFGGVLADDMGLGKTVQALAFLAREKAEGRLDKPVLIVAPTSVLPNWQAECERFVPKLKVLPLRGLERRELFGQIASSDLVLTTYPLLARDQDVLLKQEFHAAILDEAQAIKNPKANVSLIAHQIDARHRFALTGTPLENNLGEVWSLFQFLSPGLLGDETTFRRVFRTPIEKHGDTAAQKFLSQRLKPFMLRRTKAEVATELPPKTEIVERVRLEGGQRDLYETVRSLMHARVRDEIAKKGLAKSHIIFLDALLKMRQICCDPRLLKMPQARKVKSSAKLERLMEMIPEMVAEGRRILLFSQFTSMLELIEVELAALKIPYVQLTGDTVDRATPVRAFQSGQVPLFLLSLKAGGTGLNLTAADTVIHYDPWWNPAVERQATDRAHRIGQVNPVFVYKMIVEEGIEEAIELLKAKKAALAEALFDGSSKSPFDLTEADVSALFRPLGADQARKRVA